MKLSRLQTQSKAHAVPELRFETQSLTSFAGLVVIQKFFTAIDLKAHLSPCFGDLRHGKVFPRVTLFLQRVVHLLLGYRELQDCRYYQDDPLVKRLLGLRRLPDVATVSRALKEATAESVENLRRFLKDRVFTVSVPFERFVELKGLIEARRYWHRLDAERAYFETAWKPQCWDRRFRFLFIRTRTAKQQKEPVQLDLFAYNLLRELQMQVLPPSRHTTAKRACLWVFERVDTVRKTLLQRAGRLTRPQGRLTLTVSANPWMQDRLLDILRAIPASD